MRVRAASVKESPSTLLGKVPRSPAPFLLNRSLSSPPYPASHVWCVFLFHTGHRRYTTEWLLHEYFFTWRRCRLVLSKRHDWFVLLDGASRIISLSSLRGVGYLCVCFFMRFFRVKKYSRRHFVCVLSRCLNFLIHAIKSIIDNHENVLWSITQLFDLCFGFQEAPSMESLGLVGLVAMISASTLLQSCVQTLGLFYDSL